MDDERLDSDPYSYFVYYNVLSVYNILYTEYYTEWVSSRSWLFFMTIYDLLIEPRVRLLIYIFSTSYLYISAEGQFTYIPTHYTRSSRKYVKAL